MTDRAREKPDAPLRVEDRRLDSWKEIASYLRRDVTTVQRWEKREGLPIRRHHHGKLGSVYAFKSELAAWQDQRSPRLVSTSQPLATTTEVKPSVAVLPFANLSAGADDDYFSEGLAEEIINALTQIPGLKVIARTSAFAFKGRNEDVRKIAEALDVTNLLSGSVRRSGNRLRVAAQLINAKDGSHLWSQRYDRELTDVFAVQDEIAASIGKALSGALFREFAARIHEPNFPAYEAFLRARHWLAQSLPRSSEIAEGLFRKAIALDPRWPEPHSALAQEYFALGALGLRPLKEMIAFARAEAQIALDLFSADPAARAVAGAIAAVHDYDWQEAGEQFERARLTGASSPAVEIMYASYYLLPSGRFDEAIAHHTEAIRQDPLNVSTRISYLVTLDAAEQFDLAVSEARALLKFDQTNHVPYLVMASAYFREGKVVEARESAEEAFRHAPWHSGAVGFLAGLLTDAADNARVQQLLATMTGDMTPLGMLAYHLNRREIAAAADWFANAIEQRHPYAAQFAFAGFTRPLRSSPRWPVLASMMNLPSTR
jgi:serine/threonine-protein kinase